VSLTRASLGITLLVMLYVAFNLVFDLADGRGQNAPRAASELSVLAGGGSGVAGPPDEMQGRSLDEADAGRADGVAVSGDGGGLDGEDLAPVTTSGPVSSSSSVSVTASSVVSESSSTVASDSSAKGSGGGGSLGTISGNVCPCSVTGTAVLEGTVNLEGDLMVAGGTLVARPGVIVNGNGHQIMFMDGGRADFQGSRVFTWSNNGSKMNLERDIEFRNLRRIIFHQGAGPSTLKYFTVADSGTPGVLGDYPIHFHLNGNSTRGTVVEGVVVVNGRNHAYVPHGSHGITFKDTIAYKIRGDAYWWDPGQGGNDSTGIIYDHALANTITPGSTGKHRLTGFNLRGGNNTVKNSAAINIDGGADCSGFHWPEKAGDNAVWAFTNNHSTSPNCNGIFVWQNDSENHVINGFTGNKIEHGAYVNHYKYNNITVDSIDVHALGWEINNSTIGDITTSAHNDSANGQTFRINNSQIRTFEIDNADGKAPGHYILTNTNLKCADIKQTSIYPGTKITINGNNC
jgi:hypothetical protein